MAKGRSAYQFNVNSPTQAESLIQNWITQNKFKPHMLKGEPVLLSKSLMTGNKFFTYQINGNEVKLYAWCHGLAGDFDLSTQTVQSVAKPFRKMLAQLFEELKAIEK